MKDKCDERAKSLAQSVTQPAALKKFSLGLASVALPPLVLLTLASSLLIGVARAQTFTTTKGFGIMFNVTGFNPQSQLVQGPDGTLYGTTYQGNSMSTGQRSNCSRTAAASLC